ncbi:hypothetical protein ES708_21430 [subsurface metagenome]
MDEKIYPGAMYSGKRVSECGGQPVFKQILPDGELVELSPTLSQTLCNHSPDGFQWGYGGSGPAQLALALLFDATSDPKTALTYHQDFKWAFVAGWKAEWSILQSEILLWIEQQKKARLEAMISQN